MASDYTSNYQLPIWAPEDSFLRTEFNDANQKIDAAITEVAAEVETLAEAAGDRVHVSIREGTGKHGASFYTPLYFPFQPRAVFIGPMNRTAYSGGWFRYGITEATVQTAYGSSGTAHFSWEEKKVTIYSDTDSQFQFNADGVYYICIALA